MDQLRKIFFKKKILIYGLGISGYSSLNFLKKKNYIKFFDDNYQNFKNKKLKKFFISQKKIYDYGFDYIIISPGINLEKCDLKNFLNRNKEKIFTDLDVFYSNNFNNIIIAVTGTNGKSTTVKLLSDIIKSTKKDVRLVGNIGKSILSEKKVTKKTIFVVEASSYQIEYSKIFKAKYAILINISPDHLERHKTFKKYLNIKLKLIYNQKKGDFAFFNKKNILIKKELKNKNIKSKVINVDDVLNLNYNKQIKNEYFNNKNNQQNLSYVFAICKKLKINKKNILKIINNFRGLKFRQQIIYNSKKLAIINDSKSTSFSSTINLLKSYKNIYWILGGLAKKGDKFNLSSKYFKNIKCYIFGKDINFFKKKLNKKIPSISTDNLENILKKIANQIKLKQNKHSHILFSPSAASFDKFKNFEERGHYFNFLIKKTKFIKKINV